MGDGGTLADTSPTPLSTSQYKSTSGAGVQDITDAHEISTCFTSIVQLRDTFREWAPKTSVLRDLKRKL